MARAGTKVIYVPGNHDEMARDYEGVHLAGVLVVNEYMYDSADGRRFLVIHGDRFDAIVRYAKWLALAGDWAYQIAIWANNWVNRIRGRLGYPYWSLSKYLKHKVKNAVEYISSFETAVATEARRQNLAVFFVQQRGFKLGRRAARFSAQLFSAELMAHQARRLGDMDRGTPAVAEPGRCSPRSSPCPEPHGAPAGPSTRPAP